MAHGLINECLEKEKLSRSNVSVHHLMPESSQPALTDRRRKRSWQMPLAKSGSGYRLMTGIEEEESSSGEEFYDLTYTIRRGMEGYRPLPQSSTFHDIDDDILSKEDDEVSCNIQMMSCTCSCM